MSGLWERLGKWKGRAPRFVPRVGGDQYLGPEHPQFTLTLANGTQCPVCTLYPHLQEEQEQLPRPKCFSAQRWRLPPGREPWLAYFRG